MVIIGDDLESQLYVGKNIKLEMVYSLEQGTAIYDKAVLWYLRLNIVASWAERTIENKSELEKKVIENVRDISHDLLQFLNENTPLNRDRLIPHWCKLLTIFTNEMKVSSTVTIAKDWRTKRSQNGDEIAIANNRFFRKKNAYDDVSIGDKKYFSRSTRGLNVRLQNYLFREVLFQKTENEKPLNNSKNNNIKNEFEKIYSLKIKKIIIPKEKNKKLFHSEQLFNHIYDIPYQAAYLRSIDMLYNGGLSDEKLFEELHWDMELGRGLFSIALEFYMRETESPERRLSLCINQIAYIYDEIKKEKEAPILVINLKEWLEPKNNEMILELDNIIIAVKSLCGNSSALGANKLAQAFSKTNLDDHKNIRQLEIIAGYKLRDLFLILKNKENYNNDKIKKSFSALVQFLSLRKCDSNETSKKASFYNCMLAALGDIDEATKEKYEKSTDDSAFDAKYLPPSVKSVMLHRLSMTNYTPVSDPVHLISPDDNKNGRYLAKNLTHGFWRTRFNKNKEKSETWITLGRFDAISMTEVKLPCKCYIQGFEDGQTLPFEDESNLKKEAFAPHFSRREIARPVKIIVEPESHQMFAMLSVTLQRRSMRLDFLYRMIRALKNEYLKDFQSGIEEEIKNLKKNNIFVKGLLTDGWGDIVFKFSKAESEDGEIILAESDIAHIFNFQRAVYEDFMVDRTEIIFTPRCIDYTLARTDKYRITMEARMLEDRWLETGVNKYTDGLKETIDELKKDNSPLDFLENVEITMIPGRNDFSFKFIAKAPLFFTKNHHKYPNKEIKDVYLKIIKWLDKDKDEDIKGAMRMLSHVETYIGRIP